MGIEVGGGREPGRDAFRRRVVILGGGFGGAYCAQALRHHLRSLDTELLLIDRHNYFVFTPLLVEAGTGSLEPRHAVISTRAFLRDESFRMAEITAVDTDNRLVQYRVPHTHAVRTVEYNFLVIALGSVTNYPAVPGLREFAYELKSLADAVSLRDRAIEMLEVADCTDEEDARRAMLHFVFVGGNFTGAEAAGEFEVFLRDAAKQYRNLNANHISVTLVELSDRLLRALDPDLSAYAAKTLRGRGIDVRLNDSVAQIEATQVFLRSGEVLQAHTVIWCAGIAPNPLIANLPFATDDNGYIVTNRDLRTPGYKNIWAIGDCAVNCGPDGNPYPATAQHAALQAKHVARDIERVLQRRSTRPCDISSSGSLAALGCRTGVARIFGLKLSGFPAWWLWRTVYLLKMPGLARKARVALDWTINLLFPRAYVQLGIHRVVRQPSAERPEASGKTPTVLEADKHWFES